MCVASFGQARVDMHKLVGIECGQAMEQQSVDKEKKKPDGLQPQVRLAASHVDWAQELAGLEDRVVNPRSSSTNMPWVLLGRFM